MFGEVLESAPPCYVYRLRPLQTNTGAWSWELWERLTGRETGPPSKVTLITPLPITRLQDGQDEGKVHEFMAHYDQSGGIACLTFYDDGEPVARVFNHPFYLIEGHGETEELVGSRR